MSEAVSLLILHGTHHLTGAPTPVKLQVHWDLQEKRYQAVHTKDVKGATKDNFEITPLSRGIHILNH